MEEALDETCAITEHDDLPTTVSEVSEPCRDFGDNDLGQEVKLASSCGDPSGFADIGSTATVFVPSAVRPDTETDDEHPGLHESSESECGADCDYRDLESSDDDSIFSIGTCPQGFEHRLLSRNGNIDDSTIPDYVESEISEGE